MHNFCDNVTVVIQHNWFCLWQLLQFSVNYVYHRLSVCLCLSSLSLFIVSL